MENEVKQQTTTMGASCALWARRFLLLGFGFMPLVLIPAAWFPFALGKVVFFLVCLTIAGILGAVAYVKQGITISSSILPVLVGLMLGSAALAAILSQDWLDSVVGQGVETDTLFFAFVCAVTFFLVTTLFTAKESLRQLFTVLFFSTGLVALFQVLRISLGSHAPLQNVFPAISSNLIGSWNLFGLAMVILATIAIAIVDLGKANVLKRVVGGIALVGSFFLLALVSFPTLWWLLAGVSLVMGCIGLHATQASMPDGKFTLKVRQIPFAALVAVCVSVFFIVGGSRVSDVVHRAIPVQESEVRLTPQTTLEIIRSTYTQSALTTFFGSGPGTFPEQWLLYKPADLNATTFYNVDFLAGSGLIPNIAVTWGLLGSILWFALILYVVASLFTQGLAKAHDEDLHNLFILSGCATLVLLISALVYLPSQIFMVFMFASLGAFTSLGSILSRKTHHVSVGLRRKETFLATLGLCVMLGGLGASSFLMVQRFIATVYIGKAYAATTPAEAYVAAEKALKIQRNEQTLQVAATVRFARAQAIASETDAATEATRASRLQASLLTAQDAAQGATVTYPRHYTNWLALAQFYEALIPFKVDNAYAQSESAYAKVLQLAPRNPELYLRVARMEATAGNEQSSRSAVAQALTLKPNYTDAILFIVQLEIAKKDLSAAVQAATAAVQTAPQNAGLWFELGVLAYNKGDDKLAIQALSQAITLVPNYANAKYFLGLSFYRSGRQGDGVALFADLAAANPDNADVATTLGLMREGKPLAPALTSPAPDPTTLQKAPIKE